jgi:hypothetical protein
MKIYYYYIKNLIENQFDNFFSYFYVNEFFKVFDLKLSFYNVVDILKYLFFFCFVRFFFFLRSYFNKYNIKNSYLFYFVFLISDLFSFFSFFLISHSWLSLKIYEDYVHNINRRQMLKIFSTFFLIFSLIFILFYINIL